MHRKTGRNEPCPCGSGRKYKRCHGKEPPMRPSIAEKKPTQDPAFRTSIPSEKLGLPGAAYQLYAQGRRKGKNPQLPIQDLQDDYKIVLTLSRTISTSHELTFEPQAPGDS